MYSVLTFLVKIFLHLYYDYKVVNPPKKTPGRLLICANHTSMRDPFVMAASVPFRMNFVGKKELARFGLISKFLKSLGVIYIDRQANDLETLRTIIKRLDEDIPVMIFPEGTRVETVDPKNMKMGTGFLALKANSDVLVATIESDYGFRKPLTVRFHPLLEVEDYVKLGPRKGRTQLSVDIFNTIYGTTFREDEF